MGLEAMFLVFWMLSFKPTFSLSFTFITRLFSSSLSAIRMMSSEYLRLLIFLPEILIPACASSSLAYPGPEVRGSGREELPGARGQGHLPREGTPRPRPGAAAERSYGAPEVRGSSLEELPCARGQRRRPREATRHPRSGAETERSYPMSEVRSRGCTLLEQPWRETPRPR